MMLILASTSVYRRGLLERLGLYFSCVSPGVDETTIAMSANLLPREQAEWLAHQKAQAVAEKFPQATIIGCDQMAVIDGRCAAWELRFDGSPTPKNRTESNRS